MKKPIYLIFKHQLSSEYSDISTALYLTVNLKHNPCQHEINITAVTKWQ